MRFAIQPCAIVLGAVFESHYPQTLLVIVEMLAHVLISVWINEHPLSLHLAVFPIPIINKSICPLLHTFALKVIVNKIPSVNRIIRPSVRTFAMLLFILITAFVVFVKTEITLHYFKLNLVMTSLFIIIFSRNFVRRLAAFYSVLQPISGLLLGDPILLNFVRTDLPPIISVFCHELLILILMTGLKSWNLLLSFRLKLGHKLPMLVLLCVLFFFHFIHFVC